jgi:hypothetical protein
VPALYLFANAAIGFALLRGRRLEWAIAQAVAGSGLPFYAWFSRSRVSR